MSPKSTNPAPASGQAHLETQNDRILVHGPMTFQTVPALNQLGQRFMQLQPIPKFIDLANVQHADSSALALLLEWQAWAKQQKHQFVLCNTPDSLHALGRVMGVDQLLNME
jgi:phospholipid transport system transporter-binding protein